MFKGMFEQSRLIWWITGVAILLRLIVIPILGPDNENIYEYGQIAWNIVQGHGFSWDFEGRFPLQPTAYSPALYCYTLVPWFYLFGLNLTGPRIMHAILLSAVCWFLYKIGSRLANERVGLIVAVIWAIYPELIFLTVRLAPENVMFLPMIVTLYLAQKLSPVSGRKHALGTGAMCGISCWINPSLQGLGLAVPVYWLISKHFPLRKAISYILLFVTGAIIVVAPWTIRNYIRLDAFVPLRSAFAYNMWRGNHEGATGTVRTFDGTDIDEAVTPEYKAYYEAHMVPDEIERDRFFATEVKRFITQHPDEYLRLCFTRLYYFWWRDMTHPLTGHAAYLLPWILILLFSAVGLFSIRRQWREWSLWILQILGFSLMFSLTIVLPRYRMPVYPAMFLLAAAGIDRLFDKIQRKVRL